MLFIPSENWGPDPLSIRDAQSYQYTCTQEELCASLIGWEWDACYTEALVGHLCSRTPGLILYGPTICSQSTGSQNMVVSQLRIIP